MNIKQDKVIGVDLGASNIRAAIIGKDTISNIQSKHINNSGTVDEVLKDIFEVVDGLSHSTVTAIGIGVPSVVDVKQGIVYDVQYIPSWKEVHLKKLMEERYNVPVFVNNDANCFALGEHYFGKGKGVESMVGLTIGTGVGAGIIINNRLYSGVNCGAGEFGMVDYLDKIYEYYCSGSFFQNVYELDGEEVFRRAKKGDEQALKLYEEMGTHLGNAVKMIMYTHDPELIILGGSVRLAYDFFKEAMWQRIRTFAFTKSVLLLKIEISELQNSGILGAAGLCYDSNR